MPDISLWFSRVVTQGLGAGSQLSGEGATGSKALSQHQRPRCQGVSRDAFKTSIVTDRQRSCEMESGAPQKVPGPESCPTPTSAGGYT